MTPEKMIKKSLGEFSPRLISIVESVLRIPTSQRIVSPRIGRPNITSDGFVIADCGDHVGAFIGSWDEIESNFHLWADFVGLTDRAALAAWPTKDWRN